MGSKGNSGEASRWWWYLNLFKINYFLAVLGLCCCAWAFSGCSEQEPLFSCGVKAYCGGFSGGAQAAGGARASVVVTPWL